MSPFTKRKRAHRAGVTNPRTWSRFLVNPVDRLSSPTTPDSRDSSFCSRLEPNKTGRSGHEPTCRLPSQLLTNFWHLLFIALKFRLYGSRGLAGWARSSTRTRQPVLLSAATRPGIRGNFRPGRSAAPQIPHQTPPDPTDPADTKEQRGVGQTKNHAPLHSKLLLGCPLARQYSLARERIGTHDNHSGPDLPLLAS